MITNDPLPNLPPEAEDFTASNYPQPPAAEQSPNAWIELLKGVLTWLASVIFLLFIPLILVIPYFIYLAVNSGLPSADAIAQDKTFILLSIVGVIPAHVLTLLVAWILVTKRGRVSFWKALGFSWPESMPGWVGIAGSIGVAALLLAMGVLVTKFLGGEKTDLDRLIESSFQARVVTAFLAVATAPLVEEVVYRGMLYPAFERLIGMTGAIAIVSLLFAGVHVLQYRNNLGVIAVITILSVTLTVVRALSKRLLPCFVIHLIFNGLQSLYLVLEPFVSKPDSLTPAPALAQVGWAIRHLLV